MSQQEFSQESQFQDEEQGRRPLEDEISYSPQPYYWSTKPDKQGIPKDEPVSSYDEPMIQGDHQADYQHGYIAQDAVAHSNQQSSTTERSDGSIPYTTISGSAGPSRSQRAQSGSDGDSFENQYRPYNLNNQQWSVPSWARPQRNKRNSTRLFWLVLLGLIFIKPLLLILGALLAIAGVIVFALVVMLLFATMVGVLYLLLRAVGRASPRRRWRYNNYWRAPWGW